MRTVALFIDGDDVSAEFADTVLKRAGELGDLVVRRVYGDAARQAGWETGPAIRFIHAGHRKGASARLLARDAMEALSADTVDVFVLVGSGTGLGSLARRIRRQGKRTVGLSESNALVQPKVRSLRQLLRSPRAAAPGPASGLDWSIRDVIARRSQGSGGAPLRTFGLSMWNRHRTGLCDIGAGSWRDYLRARPGLYDVVDGAAGTRVRIRPEGFLTGRRSETSPFPSRAEPISIPGCRPTP
jgi:hypothetical protein